MRPAAAAALLVLAGCGPVQPTTNDEQIAETIEKIAEERPAPKRETPLPSLVAVEPGTGAGCAFSERGRLLFVSGAGGASAIVDGNRTQFAASGPTGETGGFWVTERFSISIGRLADTGANEGDATSWPARLVLTDRRRDENAELRLQGTWRCGA